MRRTPIAFAAVAGAAVGIAVTLALTGPGESTGADPVPSTSADPTQPAPTTTGAPAPTDEPSVLLAWISGGLPAGFVEHVRQVDGVRSVTLVKGDQTDLVASLDERGEVVDLVPDAWKIPLDTIAVDPTTFPAFVDGPAGAAVAALQPGQALLTATSSRLRRLDEGTVRLTTGEVAIAGTVDDLAGAGAELLVHVADADRLGVTTDRYVLIGHHGERPALQQAIAEANPHSTIRFRTPAETTWLRHGDAVVPQALVKDVYGEFAYRDRPGRDIEISPDWVDRWIVTEAVPILGDVTCHRAVVGPLRAAMQSLVDTNLAHLVDASQFAGCFFPRRIDDGAAVSRHTWGIAVDLNVGANPRGSFSTQDPRLVDTMRAHGFGWGGTWLVPDPAHYEATPPADRATRSSRSR